MRITFKFIAFFLIVTFIASLYLCWIDYHFIYGNLAMWPTVDTLTLVELTLFLSIIISFFLWRFLKVYDKAIIRIQAGEVLTNTERTATMNCYNKAVYVILIANALGFCIGKIVMTILLISRFPEMNAKALGNLGLGFIQSIMIGIIAALYETLVLNIMMAKGRKLLRIRHNTEFGKGISVSLTGKIKVVTAASFVFIGCNSFLSSFFIVSKYAEDMLPTYYAKGFEAFMLTFIPCLLLLFIITKSTKNRIKETSKLVQDFGINGDLKSRIDLSMHDDFSAMLGKLNGFLDNLSQMVLSIKEESNKAAYIANELKESMSASRNVLNQMRDSVQIVQNGRTLQDSVISAATNDVRTMEENAHLVESQIAIQTDAVLRSSSAVSQMVTNIRSVTEITEQANNFTGTLTNSTTAGTGSLTDAVHAINEIQSVSKEIEETMRIIQKISSQTNMLSMNAAIEAAHAGTYGAGFAVVADEVRGLASSSAASAKTIQSLIKAMIEKVNSGVEAINSAGIAFSTIKENIDHTTNLISNIANTMEEQNHGATDTLNATMAVQAAIHEITELSHNQSIAVKNMSLSFQDIVDTSQQVSSALATNTENSEALANAIEMVGSKIETTSKAMDKIDTQLEIFKLAE